MSREALIEMIVMLTTPPLIKGADGRITRMKRPTSCFCVARTLAAIARRSRSVDVEW